MNSRLLELACVAIVMVLGFVLALGRTYSQRLRRKTHEEQSVRDKQVLARLDRVLE